MSIQLPQLLTPAYKGLAAALKTHIDGAYEADTLISTRLCVATGIGIKDAATSLALQFKLAFTYESPEQADAVIVRDLLAQGEAAILHIIEHGKLEKTPESIPEHSKKLICLPDKNYFQGLLAETAISRESLDILSQEGSKLDLVSKHARWNSQRLAPTKTEPNTAISEIKKPQKVFITTSRSVAQD